MPSNWPTGNDNFTTGTLTGVVAGADHGNKADAINKMQATIGVGATNGRLKVVQEAPINIQWPEYGADPTGSGDCTAALQAALDAAHTSENPVTTARKGRAAVYIPYGNYRFTGGVNVRSVIGFRMFGDNAYGTRLNIDATGLDTFLDLNGVSHAEVSDLIIRGHNGSASGDVLKPVHLHWDPTTAASSTRKVVFRNIHVTELKYKYGMAVAIDNSSYQNDEISFYDCKVAGDMKTDANWWQAAYKLGSGAAGNTFAINFYDLSATSNKRCIHCHNVSFAVFGGGIQNHEVDFYIQGAHKIAAVHGLRSETSNRLLHVVGPSGSLSVVSLKNIDFHMNDLHADNNVVVHQGSGVFSLEDIILAGGQTESPTILLDNANLAGLTTKVDGMTTQTAIESILTTVANTRVPYIDNYTRVDAASLLVTRYAGRYYLPLAAADAPINSLFKDSADGKLKFKDNGGTSNALY